MSVPAADNHREKRANMARFFYARKSTIFMMRARFVWRFFCIFALVLIYANMKVKNTLLLMMAAATLLLSCGTKESKNDTPEEVTKTFVTAFYTADFDVMYQTTVKKNRPIIQVTQKEMNKNPEKLHQMRKNEIECQDVQCEMVNDTVAECKCRFIYNGNPREMTVNLRKENDNWRVDLTENY